MVGMEHLRKTGIGIMSPHYKNQKMQYAHVEVSKSLVSPRQTVARLKKINSGNKTAHLQKEPYVLDDQVRII